MGTSSRRSRRRWMLGMLGVLSGMGLAGLGVWQASPLGGAPAAEDGQDGGAQVQDDLLRPVLVGRDGGAAPQAGSRDAGPRRARRPAHAVVLDDDLPGTPRHQAPHDPLPHGPAHVDVRLFDAATGEPVGGEVALWLLDAPANEHYTAGDLRVWGGMVPKDGVRVQNLPAGRYRVCVEDAALDAQDPETIELPAEGTRIDVALHAPMHVPLGIRIVPSDPREAIQVEAPFGTVRARRQEVEPTWCQRRLWERQGVLSRVVLPRDGYFATWSRRQGLSPIAEQDAAGVWWIGRWRTPSRRERRDVHVSLGVPGGSEVRFRTEGLTTWPAAGVRFVAATMPMAWIEDAVRLPDGRRAVDDGVKVHAYGEGRPLADRERVDAADLGITIHVRDRRYEPLSVTVPAHRRPDPIELVPAAAAPAPVSGR